MLAAVTAEDHSPAVSWEPGVSLGGRSVGDGTRTVRKGVKVAFDARRIAKKMSIGSIYKEEPVRMSDQAPTSSTLIGFGAIATNSFDGRKKAEHSWFQGEEG
jgi:hypothetical protein